MLSVILSVLGGPVAKAILSGYEKKLEADNKTQTQAFKLAMKEVDARIKYDEARRDLSIASMSHPIWWCAWALFVVPVGFYHATIFLLSTMGIGPETYAVLQVPPAQEEVSRLVVQNILFAQAGSGVVGAVIRKWT